MSAPIPAAPANEDAKLDTYFREFLDAGFRLRPSTASRLGDHRFDASLDDVSAAACAGWRQYLRSYLTELPERVDATRLTRDGCIDYEIFAHTLRYRLWNEEQFEPYATDPRFYNGLLTGAVFGLLTQSTLPKEQNVANAIARIRELPKVIDAAKANLRNPPRVLVETAITQNQGAIRFYQKDIFDLAGGTPQRDELTAAAAAVVPALTAYQEFLEHDLLPRANGEWRLGAEKFGRKFEFEANAGISATEIYADALAEFERVRNTMYVVARQAWSTCFPGVALPPDDADGRRETIQQVIGHYEQDHGEPDKLIEDARTTVIAIKDFITRADILGLPKPDRCEVIEMPEFQRGNSTAYMNSPPPLDDKAAGYYAISPPPQAWDAARVKSYLEEYNSHMLQVLTIHEAYPGHYVQMEYANRNPSLIRKVLASGVFVEGWAVYTEQMMLDQGYGGGNLGLRMNQLKFYLRAVTNTILDHRMHCDNMSDAEAMDLLVNQAFQSEGEARLKVIRAKQSSVQLSTYFTGRTALYRLRQEIQRELGNSFVLGRYHEAVLAHGSLPVKYLPELVRAQLNPKSAAEPRKLLDPNGPAAAGGTPAGP